MAVVHLIPSNNRDTVAVLKVLLNEAIDGNVKDLAVIFADQGGGEHIRVTGRFRRDPSKSVRAGLRLVRTMVDEE